MDCFIDNSESLSKLEKDLELNNQLPYIQLENFKDIFLNGLTTNLNRSTDNIVKENILTDAVRKIIVAKKFVNSNVNDFYLKKTLLNSYNGLYKEIESNYETLYPDIFVIEDIRSLNNFQKKYSGYDNLIGKVLDSEKTAETQTANYFSDIFKSISIYDSFREYKDKHILDPYTDFSYLFQRMLYEGLIHKKKLMEYADWLKENEFIKDSTYQRFFEYKGLVPLKKSYSVNREHNFNSIFKL